MAKAKENNRQDEINSHSSDFIFDFKIGDNIVYNIDILNVLYDTRKTYEDKADLLEKPIIIILGSLAEAIVYDFMTSRDFKSQIHGKTRDKILSAINQNDMRNASTRIQFFLDKNILQVSNNNVYEDLKKLSRLRNRIHIQNEHKHGESNEQEVFTSDRRVESEKTVELLIRHMAEYYKRGPYYNYVAKLVLPWTSHFTDKSPT